MKCKQLVGSSQPHWCRQPATAVLVFVTDDLDERYGAVPMCHEHASECVADIGTTSEGFDDNVNVITGTWES